MIRWNGDWAEDNGSMCLFGSDECDLATAAVHVAWLLPLLSMRLPLSSSHVEHISVSQPPNLTTIGSSHPLCSLSRTF